MVVKKEKLSSKIKYLFPIILLYYFSISEIDTVFSNYFEILSFNLQLIIVYFWVLRNPSILGYGNIFFAGIINDVIMSSQLGTSSLTYLTVSLVASYIRAMTVKITLFTDWFTFIVALFFSNFVYFVLIVNFTELNMNYAELFYNTLFTFIFYPFFWLLFNSYISITGLKTNEG